MQMNKKKIFDIVSTVVVALAHIFLIAVIAPEVAKEMHPNISTINITIESGPSK